MRILLAPPFFIQRVCKHCAQIYYKENPNNWWWLYEIEKMPPLGTYKKDHGFIPDYPVLSMFEEFVMDGQAYEHLVKQKTQNWFGAWPDVVRFLKSEGSLTMVDIENELSKTSRIRGSMLRFDLKMSPDGPKQWIII